MPELEERIQDALKAVAPRVPTEGVFERLSARRRRRQLRRVVVPALAASLALLLGVALLVWPSDTNTPVATKGGARVTETTTAGDRDEATDSSVVAEDAPATTSPRRAQGRSAGGSGPATPPENLVPAGFQIFSPRGGPSNALGIARFDFTDQRLLFTYPPDTRAGTAAWSPSRDRIAVSYCTSARSCTVRTVTPDGKISETLGAGVIRPGAAESWSPDGRWIAVQESFEDPDASIVPSTGGPVRKVGVDTSAVLAWSPDSKRIAYVDTGVLTIANVDGGDLRKFVDPMQQDTSRTTQPVSVAAWSPDGRTLAVSRGYLPKPEDSANNPLNTPTPATALIDLGAESWRELGDWEFRGDWTHDGSSLIVRVPRIWRSAIGARGCPGDSPVVGLDTQTGARRSFGAGCSMGLSPDGASVYVAEMRQVRVVPVAGSDPQGRVVYAPDESHPTSSFNVHCCEWSPGSDAVVETDHRVVVRIDGRGRWEPPR